MRRRSLLLAWVMACSLGLTNGVSQASETHGQEVHIDNFSFTLDVITVDTGTTVVWINRDDIPHTVTDAGQPLLFKSRPLDTDQQFAQVFTKPGTYHYFCSLHPHMQGTVVVK